MSTLIITGKLEARTALHVGSGRSSSEADALLRRNGAGELVIPGSAIAGSLRALATRLAPRLGGGVCKALQAKAQSGSACGCAACHLFGDLDPQEENVEESGGRAARLWVYDAELEGSPATAIRDGVGIDRRTGAAARQEAIKFDLEVLPAGAVYGLRLKLDGASGLDEPLLAAALAEWQAGRGGLGGRVARGLGAFELAGLTCWKQDLDSADALMAFLRNDDPLAGATKVETWLADRLVQAQSAVQTKEEDNPWVARGWVDMEFTLQSSGPFLAGDVTAARRSGFDHAPLVENGRPVLPGSSLRGVLRSQAERIARTLATRWAKDEDAFLESCPACSPVARPVEGEAVPLECCDSLLAKPPDEETGEQELCLACRLFGSAGLGSRLVVEDAPLKVGTEPVYKVQDFLAVDRFTGGGREGAKFDAAVLWKPAFSARLRLENPRDWELGWLALLLRDLGEGELSAGFGRAKGFGRVTVPRWTVRLGFLQGGDLPVDQALLAGVAEPKREIYRTITLKGQCLVQNGQARWELDQSSDSQSWTGQIQTWVEAFTGQVKTLKRREGGLPPLTLDSYFGRSVLGRPMEEAYPRPMEVRSDG